MRERAQLLNSFGKELFRFPFHVELVEFREGKQEEEKDEEEGYEEEEDDEDEDADEEDEEDGQELQKKIQKIEAAAMMVVRILLDNKTKLREMGKKSQLFSLPVKMLIDPERHLYQLLLQN